MTRTTVVVCAGTLLLGLGSPAFARAIPFVMRISERRMFTPVGRSMRGSSATE
jgi:hypothetical protein